MAIDNATENGVPTVTCNHRVRSKRRMRRAVRASTDIGTCTRRSE
jgi:hypothetical protein